MTQAQLTVWRNRLLSDWAQVRETLIGQLKACRRDEWAEQVGHCEQDQLVELTSRLDLPKVEQSVARLKRIDAALCQMDLGLYGLCSDCEEPLSIEQLEQDPTLQRCPRCEAAIARDSTPTNCEGCTSVHPLNPQHWLLRRSCPILNRISLFEGMRCVQTLVVMVFVLPGYGTGVIGRGLGRLAALQLSQ